MAWLRHTVTVLPAEEPITLQDVKENCRVFGNADDIALNAYIRAARSSVEDRCGVKLITQTCQLLGGSWCDLKRLNIYPLQSVSSIKYLDASGVEQTLSTSAYSVVVGRSPTVYFKTGQVAPEHYCSPDAIRLTGVFGFGNSTKVPDSIKLAMYLMVGGWNENREALGLDNLALLPNGIETLLADYS